MHCFVFLRTSKENKGRLNEKQSFTSTDEKSHERIKKKSKINWELTGRITSTKTKSEGKTMLNVDEGNYWTWIQLDNQTRKYQNKTGDNQN